jgi:hypothetical protein
MVSGDLRMHHDGVFAESMLDATALPQQPGYADRQAQHLNSGGAALANSPAGAVDVLAA